MQKKYSKKFVISLKNKILNLEKEKYKLIDENVDLSIRLRTSWRDVHTLKRMILLKIPEEQKIMNMLTGKGGDIKIHGPANLPTT